jgi:hypothetical protein
MGSFVGWEGMLGDLVKKLREAGLWSSGAVAKVCEKAFRF